MFNAAQGLNHLIWYTSMRAATSGKVVPTILLDSIYTILMVVVFKKMTETKGWLQWAALLSGGAIGTWMGLVLPL